MSSKITDAIHQLKDSMASLTAAVPAVHDTITEKENQIEKLRIQYMQTHTKDFAGVWNLNLHNHTDYFLRGWRYTDTYWESTGDARGDALSIALGIPEEGGEYTTIRIPYGDVVLSACDVAEIVLSFHGGDIEITFYNLTREEMFGFLKANDMMIEIPYVDERIDDLQEALETLQNFKQATINQNLVVGEQSTIATFDECQYKEEMGIGICCYPPLDVPEPEPTAVQFNAKAVAVLHQHVAITYDYLSNVLTQLHDNPEDVEVVKGMTHALFNVQSELDYIADEVGGLDTKPEPEDVFQDGAVYWNMLQAAMYELNGTINYVVEQENPLFAEVRHRLGKLDGMLNNCCKEFEDKWMDNEKD